MHFKLLLLKQENPKYKDSKQKSENLTDVVYSHGISSLGSKI